ncbi:protein NCBP2AS2 [Ara ararauna]
MVLRRVLLALLSSPRVVERLSESRPIRAAARLTAAAITRGQLGARRAARDLTPCLLRLRDAVLAELKGSARGWPWPPRRGSGQGGRPGAAP